MTFNISNCSVSVQDTGRTVYVAVNNTRVVGCKEVKPSLNNLVKMWWILRVFSNDILINSCGFKNQHVKLMRNFNDNLQKEVICL